ncbi:iron donor protein CyaY [Pseudidiomarina taiwanensis]|uniref:Iron-sulfur cluster assembly protein CyaY n=1 Tax=Pseudidiomarina taiwanensis TaxID=337250 RepID=A0A432ZFE9_9GAMM|nr:iron donor protein CyaY [Pseudidiomarina taiwanensis]RUO76629.1 iron donor protein CyaY [Pseudidiomarina taiwanensis]
MQEHEYHELAENTILAIEEAVENCGVDIDTESGGDILELTFPNNTKMVINKQPPLMQLWVATKFNGHHFEYRDGAWIDNRTGVELWALLNEAGEKQAGEPLNLAPGA